MTSVPERPLERKTPATALNGRASAPIRRDRTQREEEAPARHEALRQEILSDAPEGREPTREARKGAWMLFRILVAVGVVGLLIFLWSIGGWKALVIGAILAVIFYFIMFGSVYLAAALRYKDKQAADRKATAIEDHQDSRQRPAN